MAEFYITAHPHELGLVVSVFMLDLNGMVCVRSALNEPLTYSTQDIALYEMVASLSNIARRVLWDVKQPDDYCELLLLISTIGNFTLLKPADSSPNLTHAKDLLDRLDNFFRSHPTIAFRIKDGPAYSKSDAQHELDTASRRFRKWYLKGTVLYELHHLLEDAKYWPSEEASKAEALYHKVFDTAMVSTQLHCRCCANFTQSIDQLNALRRTILVAEFILYRDHKPDAAISEHFAQHFPDHQSFVVHSGVMQCLKAGLATTDNHYDIAFIDQGICPNRTENHRAKSHQPSIRSHKTLVIRRDMSASSRRSGIYNTIPHAQIHCTAHSRTNRLVS